MKISVSLPDGDVEYLDSYARAQGHKSRSAVLHKAVRTLRATELGSCYEDAWQTWKLTDEAIVWESATADGLSS